MAATLQDPFRCRCVLTVGAARLHLVIRWRNGALLRELLKPAPPAEPCTNQPGAHACNQKGYGDPDEVTGGSREDWW